MTTRSELARFTITGGTEPTDKVAVTAEEETLLSSQGFVVVEHHVSGHRSVCGWWADALSAVTYAAQHAGWPVKAVEWDQVGDSRYWPGNTVEGAHRVPVPLPVA